MKTVSCTEENTDDTSPERFAARATKSVSGTTMHLISRNIHRRCCGQAAGRRDCSFSGIPSVPVLSAILLAAIACSEPKDSGAVGGPPPSEEMEYSRTAAILEFAADTYTYERRWLFLMETSVALAEMTDELDTLSAAVDALQGMTRIDARRELKRLSARNLELESWNNCAAVNVDIAAWPSVRSGILDVFTAVVGDVFRFRKRVT